MTTEIQTTIDAIKKVTKKALRSKKASRQFLVDAGIIKGVKTKQIIKL